jgi:LysM repeat protein
MYNEICPSNSTQYVVKEGDTLWKLSQAYGVSVQSILDVNPGINPQNLQIGSTLCIPTAQTVSPTKAAPPTPAAPSTSEILPVTCPKDTFRYTIQSGDTLWKLSQAYGVSVQNIIDANPGINADNLQIGSTLCIPTVQTVSPTKTVTPTPAAPSTSEILPVTCPQGTFRYTIQSGDTLWKLSQAYGVSVQSILDVNPGINPQNLQIGSTLCIPIVQTVSPTKAAPLTSEILPVTCPKDTFRYTIQSGDTLWKLSQSHGVSLQSILDVNPGINPQNLQIGSTLCIPTAQTVSPTKAAPSTSEILPVTCPKGTFRYTIQSGDTLWKLSQAYGVSIQNIIDANPGINADNLQIGSTLCIPTVQTVSPTKTVTPTPAAPQTAVASSRHFAYCIKRCDTICGIARNFYVSVESILRENPEINPRCLQVGTYIYVPINCCGENTWRYTVREGDTLNRIANKLNVCPSEIIAANPNIDFQHLIHCQVICIPKE